MIKAAGAKFETLGLKTRWLLGDCANIQGCTMYASYIYQDAEVRPYLGPLAAHSWGVLDLQGGEITRFADFALEYGLDVWMTEMGWDAFLYSRPEEYPTWLNGVKLAATYSRVLQLSRASVLLYWEFLGNDYSLNDGTQPYPALRLLAQLVEAFPEDTRVLHTAVNTTGLYAVAGEAPSHTVLHVVNLSPDPRTVRIVGLPVGVYEHVVSTEDIVERLAGTVRVGEETILLDLAPMSVHMLMARR